MDKIERALKKLSVKERETIRGILLQLDQGNLAGLEISKLKGRRDIFRVRKGKMRIIFRQSNSEIFVLGIERRSERTYKGF
ncbi:MAG: hypothetical protein DMF75_22330 [Acidobacteria bacterium]|nr:MAG: hypothetical protein DMF75_22330 [Acidobacteriota bacterium]